MRCRWLLPGLILAGPLAAQVPVFREQVGLLNDAGNSNLPFTSGFPMGVVDLNGDRKDDIVRLHDARFLNIEYQTAPGVLFGHRYHGPVAAANSLIFGLCVADVDGNGFADLVLGDVGNLVGHDLFLANAAGTAFGSPVALTPAVDVSQAAIFADLDNDGLLDLFACDDVDDNHKWRNTGGGTFVFQNSLLPTAFPNASDDAGNYAMVGTDYDRDGDVDYYLSKCRQGEDSPTSRERINRLFRNNGDGSYTDVPGASGLASGDQTWAADFGDIDNDGDMDCFLLNHEYASEDSGPSRLYRNNGSGNFTDITAAAGLFGVVGFWGFQSLFRDFNNDGWVDLLVGNGGYSGQSPFTGIYLNDGDGTFTSYTTTPVVFKDRNGLHVFRLHSFAVGDLNHDGFLDLYAGRARGISFLGLPESDLLFFNEGNANGFLSVMLVGDESNSHGVGARIEAHGPWGIQTREVRGGESYGIMNSYNTHFGLGAATAVTSLKVFWPSGTVDVIPAVPGDRFLSVYEGTGAVAMRFADWIGDYFPAGGTDAAVDGDPDRDGGPNLVEQLRGTDPKVPNGGPGLVPVREEDGGQQYLRVSVARVPMLDVALRMEFSTNGTAWSTPPGVEVLEDSPTAYVVRLAVDPGAEPVGFARLVVAQTAP